MQNKEAQDVVECFDSEDFYKYIIKMFLDFKHLTGQGIFDGIYLMKAPLKETL